MAARSIIGWWEHGCPFDLAFFVVGLGGLFIVFTILFEWGILRSLCRQRLQIYENGIIPYHIYWRDLLKGNVTVPWEKIKTGGYLNPYDTSPLFLRRMEVHRSILRSSPAFYHIYFLEMEGPKFLQLLGKGLYAVEIHLSDLRGSHGEKYSLEEILKTVKEEVKIEEKVKILKYEDWDQIAKARRIDTGQ